MVPPISSLTEAVVLTVITVCSGNMCRSPLAAQLLRARMADLAPRITFRSLGTMARDGDPMHPQAAGWSRYLGGNPDDHRTTYLSSGRVAAADLVLGMAREHRRAAVTAAPALTRRSFTMRELARLSARMSDTELRRGLVPDRTAPDEERLRSVLRVVASTRGAVPPPADPADDDVVDPIGRPASVFELAARQIDDASVQVERVLRTALEG